MKHFGTDGIRGVVDDTLHFSLAYSVGKSIAANIMKQNLTKKVIIGKDTRLSGDLLTHAIACGLMDFGITVEMLGVVPTGCVSYLSSKLDVGYGVMVTASHNAPNMNGIKIMNRFGYKLTDQEEQNIEETMEECHLLPVFEKGTISHRSDLVTKYENHLKNIAPPLNGIRIAVDCANGSNSVFAPKLLRDLGAEVISIHCEQNGAIINQNSGALHSEKLREEVLLHHCHIGFAFDGDADRLVVILNNGKELMGDELLYLFANYMLENDELNSLTVVGTIMTNLGCEESLKQQGIRLLRTDVGDKNVIEAMRANNYALGGESSGHICFRNYNTTCDELLNALVLLKIVQNNFSQIYTKLLPFKKYNSVLKNIAITKELRKVFNTDETIQTKLKDIIAQYTDVKIIVRPSGTESVIRIFCESPDSAKNQKVACQIEKFLKNQMKQCCQKM